VNLTPRVAALDPVLHHLGTVLRFEASHSGSGSRLMADSLVRARCVQLLRSHSDLSAAAWPSRPTLSFPRLNRVVNHMRANLDRPMSLSELAGVCGLSATHFSRAFRQALGNPPHAYLINLRLARAIDLLEHTRLPVTEIALSCGFEQSQYFATLFRRKFGLTPSRWRIERGN
jgi:AraC family transcriptional regulator